MVWLSDGEKNSKISIRFDTTHERDRHTDRHHRPRLCIVSRGKNQTDQSCRSPIFAISEDNWSALCIEMCDGAMILPRTMSWAVCFATSSAVSFAHLLFRLRDLECTIGVLKHLCPIILPAVIVTSFIWPFRLSPIIHFLLSQSLPPASSHTRQKDVLENYYSYGIYSIV